MDFLVLGPLAARHGGRRVDLGSRRRERCLLGLLLLEPGRVLGVDRLIDLLWENDPPAQARTTLSSHVSRLRSRLDPDRQGARGVRLRTLGDGYVLDVAADSVDAHRFRALTETAAALTDPADRSRMLADALALWRGDLLEDVATDRLRARIGASWADIRLGAAEAKLEADLACGRQVAAVREVAGIVDEHPFRERLVALFLLGLYRAGRQTDALATYRAIRDRWVDELGLDPGPEVRSMHEAILRHDPVLRPGGTATPRIPAMGGRPPAQLPAPPRHFTGRARELGELDAALARTGDDGSLAIATVVGPAGVGKTALALRWAGAARGRFHDGQLYLNLRGFSTQRPTAPLDGLGQLLRGLGVPPERVPAGVDEAAALYRSLLVERRVLIVLDDAAGVDQVRPLFPGGRGCAVVVTSRNRLGGLTAIEGAHRISLAPFDIDEALTLLRSVLGAERVDREPDAVFDLAEACDRLPLALRVAAANVGDASPGGVAAYVRGLRSSRLAALRVADDENAAVRVALELSYRRLAPPARRLFRLIALAPGGDLGVRAAAALAATGLAEAARLAEDLTDAHLLYELRPGRHAMHDLVRAHAAERLDRDEPAGERDAAAERLLDWYLALADAVVRLATPHRDRPPLRPRHAPAEGIVPTDRDEALALLDEERVGLRTLMRFATQRGGDRGAAHLAQLLAGYFYVRGDGADSLAVYQAGLAAAQRGGDATLVAAFHNSSGIGNAVLRRWPEAVTHLRRARAKYRRLGDREAEARVLGNLGRVMYETGRLDEALAVYHESLHLCESAGQTARTPYLWNSIGHAYVVQGQPSRAMAFLTRALAAFRDRGDRRGEAFTLDTLGSAHLALGDHDAALQHFHAALDAAREAGSRAAEAATLTNLATAHLARGWATAAIEHLGLAARHYASLDDRHAEAVVRRKLAEAHLASGDTAAARSEVGAAEAIRAGLPDAAEEASLRQVRSEVMTGGRR